MRSDHFLIKPVFYIFLLFLCLDFPNAIKADWNYEFIALGTLGGLTSSANDVNNLGQIVGHAETTVPEAHAFIVNPEDTDGDGKPDLWYRDDDLDGVNDLMADLGTLGGNHSYAYGINNYSQVVGYANTSQEYTIHAFLITPLDTDYDGKPDLWYYDANQDGANDLMMDLGGTNSHANGINDLGQVVGESYFAGLEHAFLWHYNTGMIDLGSFGGYSHALAINMNEQITGSSAYYSSHSCAFIWEDNGLGLVDLGTFGGLNSQGRDINDLGQIVGSAQTPNEEYHAFLWQENLNMVDLGKLGYRNTYAEGINNRGEIVGYAQPQTHAFYWEDGFMTDLNDYLPTGSDWVLEYAYAINDGGQIVGRGRDVDYNYRAFLFNTIPSEFPILSNGSVTPTSGFYGTRFEFTVRYYHGEGISPMNIFVNIDGTDYEMSLKGGASSNGIFHYCTRDLSEDTPHIYYFHAEDGQGGSGSFPESSNLYGPTVCDPELFLSGLPEPGSWMIVELWGVVNGMWVVAGSGEPGPFYVPATGLTFDIGPGGIYMIKPITADPAYLDSYGYGAKDFQIPPNAPPGVRFIQGATRIGTFWAKTNRESVMISERMRLANE